VKNVRYNKYNNSGGKDMSVNIGDKAPDFTLPSVNDGDITLSDYQGKKNVVLSFHIFDFTGG
jgi:peroxiredoxin